MKTAAINMQKVEVDHFYIQRFNMSVHTENSLDNFSCVYYYKYVVRYRTIIRLRNPHQSSIKQFGRVLNNIKYSYLLTC